MPAEKERVNLLAALVLATLTATGLAPLRYGSPPPDFAVPTRAGVEPLSHLRGKPIVINFWASWCPPCTDELPYFARLEQSYGSRITLVTVSNEATGVARDYLQREHLSLPLIEDPAGDIFKKYDVPPIPDTIVLDAAGNVSYVSVGGLSWNELEAAVERALDEPSSGRTAGSS